MQCLCKSGETRHLKVEADAEADPIWCQLCSYNINMDEIPVDSGLKQELLIWLEKYGKWIDWDNDRLFPGAEKLEEVHNDIGRILTNKVKVQLGKQYQVIFLHSVTVKSYNDF